MYYRAMNATRAQMIVESKLFDRVKQLGNSVFQVLGKHRRRNRNDKPGERCHQSRIDPFGELLAA